jgi:hypothetical protein
MVDIKSDSVQCVHYWDIDEPHGRYSKGICRLCNEVEYFSNVLIIDKNTPFRTKGNGIDKKSRRKSKGLS